MSLGIILGCYYVFSTMYYKIQYRVNSCSQNSYTKCQILDNTWVLGISTKCFKLFMIWYKKFTGGPVVRIRIIILWFTTWK